MTYNPELSPADLESLATEQVGASTAEMDLLSMEDRMMMINAEDAMVAAAVGREVPNIAAAARCAAQSLRTGGRLLYVGAGTSGRLGVLDASECPPTFGTEPWQVQGIIAGGSNAMFQAVEGAEDAPLQGETDLNALPVSALDTVVGISASGRAPYVLGALRAAKRAGAATVSLSGCRPSESGLIADISIAPLVGPEILAGSTRLKNGTAQKLTLNMISTGAMIELGKTYGNLMVDVRATNHKLKARALRIVCLVSGRSIEDLQQALAECEGSAKLAIVRLVTGKSPAAARETLEAVQGNLRRALSERASS